MIHPGPNVRPRPSLLWLLMAALLLGGCSYRLAGKGNTLPEHVRRIALPIFVNETDQPEIAQRITEQVANEFIRRGNYTTTSSPDDSQALLSGKVVSYRSRPVSIDSEGRANRYEIEIHLEAQLDDLVHGVTLWKDSHFVFRKQYDVEAQEEQFFDESIVAIELVSRDFARTVVATILEGF